ncbi:hypothetical protein D5S18_24080 [Nocardia panacis]|uniref:Uncharacterized protein n=1 Tax=Nocardia panacis TaxID=2340916 RepID=A0A3A4KAY1_9NOCA|nr:hypothetical protein [Nocardia panacis]RJO72238.1 hypothetical protein D5S18_24080 [Nocardia panacis]
MTTVQIERRLGELETRVTDIEDVHVETMYKLTRRVTGIEIVQRRGLELILERLGVPAHRIEQVVAPAEAEIDAALDELC